MLQILLNQYRQRQYATLTMYVHRSKKKKTSHGTTSSSSSSSSEASITQQLRTEVAHLRSENTKLRSENAQLRSLHTVHVIDVDKDNEVSSYLPPTKTLHDNKTRKRKRDAQPTDSLEHQQEENFKRTKIKVEKVEASLSQSKKETAQAQDELEEAVDELNCIICMDKRKAILLLPCTHLNMCETCAQALPEQICPTCRAPISKQQKVYIT